MTPLLAEPIANQSEMQAQATVKTALRRMASRVSGDTRPNPSRPGEKLLDPFRHKMRSLHDALA